MQQADPLDAIASLPPRFTVAETAQVVRAHYGLAGDLWPLVSERDQNFRLTTEHKQSFVVKIANAVEPEIVTDFQICALLHLENSTCQIPLPRIVRALDGSVSTSMQGHDSLHRVRVVTFVPGRPLDRISPDIRLASELGSCLAEIDIALHDFEHPGDSQSLLWDMQRASGLRDVMTHIADPDLRRSVQAVLDDFEKNVAPVLPGLRNQVIHNDLNPDNVLVTEGRPASIAGVIDFGDMVRAPLIIDVAIAASYLPATGADSLALLAAFVRGYDAVMRLEATELDLLYDLVRMRLATTITVSHWRRTERADDDAYTLKTLQGDGNADRFLARMSAISAAEFAARIRQECDH